MDHIKAVDDKRITIEFVYKHSNTANYSKDVEKHNNPEHVTADMQLKQSNNKR